MGGSNHLATSNSSWCGGFNSGSSPAHRSIPRHGHLWCGLSLLREHALGSIPLTTWRSHVHSELHYRPTQTIHHLTAAIQSCDPFTMLTLCLVTPFPNKRLTNPYPLESTHPLQTSPKNFPTLTRLPSPPHMKRTLNFTPGEAITNIPSYHVSPLNKKNEDEFLLNINQASSLRSL